MKIFREYLESKYGLWEILASDKGVTSVRRIIDPNNLEDERPNEISALAKTELEKYFKGVLRRFNVEVDFQDGTEFQHKVWKELQFVEYGTTASYQFLANQLDNPNAVRAVGAANGANPIPIIIPCHRIIGSDGSLTGYSGGIELKRQLLQHEGAIPKSLFD